MNCQLIFKRVPFILLLIVAIASAQQENFVGEVALLDEQSINVDSGVASSALETIVLAQSEAEDNSESETDLNDNESDTNGDDDSTTWADQHSLPKSSTPVAVDVNLQSGSPVGQNTQDALSRPSGVKLDSATGFFPSLTIGISKQSNPSRDSSEVADDQSDTVVRIIPSLAYRGAINNRHPYELGISGSNESFDGFSNLDSDTVVYNGAVNLDITEIVQADLFLKHAESNDPRGATATRILDAASENDEYERDTFGGRVTIGRRSNTLQLMLKTEERDIDFTNNGQDSRDRDDSTVGAGLYWNVGPKTSLFANLEKTDVDYVRSSQNGFDSEEKSTTVGIGWEPSFNISIIFEVGNLDKDLNNPLLQDYDGTTYTGKVNWVPVNNTSVGLYTSKMTEETTDFRSPFIETELIGINLVHSFTDRFRGHVFLNSINDDLVNVRQDDITDFGVGAFYDFTRWLTLGANWQKSNRDSTDPETEYDSDSFSITANIHLRNQPSIGGLQTAADAGQGTSE